MRGRDIGRMETMRQGGLRHEIDCILYLSSTWHWHYGPPRRWGVSFHATWRESDQFSALRQPGSNVTRYYLGVDGGGTNCRVRLADENLVTLADAGSGRSNLQIDNGEPAFRSISEGTREAFSKAGIDFAETRNTYACFGMAGGRLESARAEFARRPWPFAAVKVYDDIDIARAGAHGGEDGGVIIVGTGSAAMALVKGQRFQCGGWGFHIGDQMSGAILGRELVRRTVEANDGLVTGSPLTDAVLERLGGS